MPLGYFLKNYCKKYTLKKCTYSFEGSVKMSTLKWRMLTNNFHLMKH